MRWVAVALLVVLVGVPGCSTKGGLPAPALCMEPVATNGVIRVSPTTTAAPTSRLVGRIQVADANSTLDAVRSQLSRMTVHLRMDDSEAIVASARVDVRGCFVANLPSSGTVHVYGYLRVESGCGQERPWIVRGDARHDGGVSGFEGELRPQPVVFAAPTPPRVKLTMTVAAASAAAPTDVRGTLDGAWPIACEAALSGANASWRVWVTPAPSSASQAMRAAPSTTGQGLPAAFRVPVSKPGTYLVHAEASDDDGSGTATKTIVVGGNQSSDAVAAGRKVLLQDDAENGTHAWRLRNVTDPGGVEHPRPDGWQIVAIEDGGHAWWSGNGVLANTTLSANVTLPADGALHAIAFRLWSCLGDVPDFTLTAQGPGGRTLTWRLQQDNVDDWRWVLVDLSSVTGGEVHLSLRVRTGAIAIGNACGEPGVRIDDIVVV